MLLRAVRTIWRTVLGFVARQPRIPHWLDRTRSALPRRVLGPIQRATFKYEYRGLKCVKNPFDMALYALLIGRLRPKTIVEVGSGKGGSALWFADQMRAHGLPPNVVSADIQPVVDVAAEGVRFLAGDIHNLAASELPAILAACPRPLLIIEDGPHTLEGCLEALRFFDGHLRSGEFIVVEDGILRDLGLKSLDNGPNRAVAEFLGANADKYVVDRTYCDFFGHNVTWNTNGYLRRL